MTIQLSPINPEPTTVAARASKTISLTAGGLSVKYNKKDISALEITLPEDTSSYFQTSQGVTNIVENNLPKIVLTLTTPDGKGINTVGTISSTHGLLIPGTIENNTYDIS